MNYKITIDGIANGKIQWSIAFVNASGKSDTEEQRIIGIAKEFVKSLEALRGTR